MKRIIINNICINTLAFLILLLTSCVPFNPPKEDKPTNKVKLEKVMDQIDKGLYKVKQLNYNPYIQRGRIMHNATTKIT